MSYEALELALALHATPERNQDLRQRPLPAQGVATLLRVALRQEEALNEAASVFPGESSRLVDAARFYVEQQLLSREFDQDPWRILGCNPGAPIEQLRAHHHLLVRLVHPDRSDDWASTFADRVNRAWRQLRSEEGRAAVAATRTNVVVEDTWKPRAASMRHAYVGEKADRLMPDAPARAARGSGRSMLFGTAAFILAVTVGWMARSITAPGTEDSAPTPAETPEATPWYADTSSATASEAPKAEGVPALAAPVPIAILEAKSDLPVAAVPAQVPPTDAPRPVPKPRAAERAPRVAKAEEVSQTATPKDVPVVSVPTPPSVIEPENVDESLLAGQVAATFGEAPLPADDSESPPPIASATEIVKPTELSLLGAAPDLLKEYRDRFARGDLGGLLGLYAPEVHADARRVATLANQYKDLFENSQQRYLDFSRIRWQERGARVYGQARFERGYRKRSSLRKVVEQGDVAIEVVRDRDAAKLRSLVLRAD